MNESKDFKQMQTLERCFWGIWAVIPFPAAVLVHYMWTEPYADFRGHDPQIPKNFSLPGQILVLLDFVISVGLYILIIAMCHLLVRRFSRGLALVKETLDTIKRIAFILLTYAAIELPIYNLNLYILHAWGDIDYWEPVYYIDLIGPSMALLLFAFSILIRKAVRLQEEADLTV